MADRTIRVTVVGDSRSLKSALKGSEASLKSLDASAAKSQQSLQKMDQGFSNVGKWAALAAGASAVSAAFMKVVDAASQLQSATAANERVFGGETTRMQEAAKAAQDYGLSQAQYLQTSAKLGAQLQNLGMEQDAAATSAQSLMRMGENLAAVFGTDVPMAVTAISAALRGEFDPLEQYGVKLTAAKVAAKQSADGISQAQAVMALAMEQSEFSVGAAAAAMDTYAGKQRAFTASWEDAQAAIGKGFLPVASAVVDTLAKMANLVQSIPQGVMEFAGTLVAAYAGVKALQFGLGAMAAKTAAWSTAMTATGGYAATAGVGMSRFSTALSKTGQTIPFFGALLVGLGEAWSAADERIKEAATSQEEFTSALMDTGLTAPQLDSVAASVERVGRGVSGWQRAATILAGGVLGGALFDKWLNIDTAAAQAEIDNLNSSLRELMAVNPTEGALAVQATFDALVAKGMPAAVAIQHLSGSMIEANQAIAQWMSSTTVAASNMQGLVAAFDAATEAATKTSHAFDALFSGLDVDVAVADWKAALKGISKAGQLQDPHVIQSLNQQWQGVTEAMQKNGATVGELIKKWSNMRTATRNALAEIGVRGAAATTVLDKIFGQRREVKAAFKLDITEAKTNSTVADRMINAVKQNSPAKIVARWFGKGETSRADRDIAGVKQDNPATITADGSQAISEALTVTNALYGIPSYIPVMIEVAANVIGRANDFIDRALSADMGLSSYDEFGPEEFPWFGPQMRDASPNNWVRQALKSSGVGFKKRITLELALSGEWSVAILNAAKLEKLAAQTDKKGRATRVAKAAREELRDRRELLRTVQDHIRAVKVMYNGDKVGYAKLKRTLDGLRASMRQLASEMREALNAVDIGQAWDAAQTSISDTADELARLKAQQDEFTKAKAETWNPRLIDYYNWKLLALKDQIRAITDAQVTPGQALGQQLDAQLNKTRRFYNAVNKLRASGLSDAALQELVRTGAEQGADIAEALVGDTALRQKYDAVFKDAARFSNSLGDAIANDAYYDRIKEVTNAIAKLRKKLEDWLNKPARKKVRVTFQYDRFVLPRAPNLPAWQAPRSQSSTQTVNVNIKGMVVDPEGTARVIKKLLRDSANRNGKVSWAA